jgi:hypothetical protein
MDFQYNLLSWIFYRRPQCFSIYNDVRCAVHPKNGCSQLPVTLYSITWQQYIFQKPKPANGGQKIFFLNPSRSEKRVIIIIVIIIIHTTTSTTVGRVELSRYSDWLRAGRSGIEFRWGREFPPVQTGPGAYAASCTMGPWSFPGVKCGRGVLLTTHPIL